jgi:hypothetical protein
MKIRIYQAVPLIFVLASCLAGCRSAKEYASLAQAGTIYATALDNLLVATGNITIDTTSERLLQLDSQSNRTLEQYRQLSNEDENFLKTLSRLRRHVQLLAKYFGQLHELANSDAPERAKQVIGGPESGLIGNLNKVGNELRGSALISGAAASAAAPITAAIMSGLIRGALKEELELRKDTIQKELILQEELLQALSDKIKHDLTITQETKEQRLVIEPLRSPNPIPNPDTWINNRRSVLTLILTADQLKSASDSVKKLREAFEDLLSGKKLTIDRINTVLADFDRLLTIAEKLKT